MSGESALVASGEQIELNFAHSMRPGGPTWQISAPGQPALRRAIDGITGKVVPL
ncbi:MAG: hypothetical protein IPI67_14385 [Myxococcales bacterium]|nr:hypothetical protein [Myxococcales bacterium]